MNRGQPADAAGRSPWENRGLALAAAAAGLLCGWVGTTPAVSMGVNWDAAAYAAEIASGRQGWSAPPWSSHYALGPIYVTAAAVARALGGTVLDGLRAVGALALAAAAAALAGAFRRLCASRTLAFGLVLAWLASWGLLTLVCTWEDNVLFLPFGIGATVLAIARLDRWRLRDSLAAGLLVGAGSLVSWQAAVYLFPPLYVCACFGGTSRPPARRLGQAVSLLGAFLAARLGWALFYHLTSDGLSLRVLLGTLFARPEPNYFPRGLAGWWELGRAWRTVLRHVAIGVQQVLGPWGQQGAPRGDGLLIFGGLVLLGALAAVVGTFRRALRRGPTVGHLLAATTFALLLSAALYVDLPIDKYKRYDFLPALVLLAGAAGLGAWRARAGRLPCLARALVGGLLLGQITLAFVAHARFRARLPSAEPAGYHGRGGETWFAFARRLRERTPDRCSYLFAFAEVRHARYQLEIVAALWSELPGATVLGAPAEAATWRRPLPTPSPGKERPILRGCEWVSPEARRLLP